MQVKGKHEEDRGVAKTEADDMLGALMRRFLPASECFFFTSIGMSAAGRDT